LGFAIALTGVAYARDCICRGKYRIFRHHQSSRACGDYQTAPEVNPHTLSSPKRSQKWSAYKASSRTKLLKRLMTFSSRIPTSHQRQKLPSERIFIGGSWPDKRMVGGRLKIWPRGICHKSDSVLMAWRKRQWNATGPISS